MSEQLRQSMIDISKVITAALATLGVCKTNALAVVSGADVKLFLECVLITATIIYTLLRVAKLRKDKKESE